MKFQFKISIIEENLKQYRKPFYKFLRERLEQNNVELILIYGVPAGSEAEKKDFIKVEWANYIKNRYLKVGLHNLCWQPCLSLLRSSDFVIVDQGSRFLINYVLFLLQIFMVKKFCFWGHGKNYQKRNSNLIGEVLKRFMSRRVHWWFAYNDFSARVVSSLGYPESRITSVQNAIDTRYLTGVSRKISEQTLNQIRIEFGIKGKNVCIYTGGMYPEKRISFLLEACLQIKKNVSDFEMIFIGAGPEDNKIKKMAKKCEWIHYIGPAFDESKVPFFMLSKLLLIPGSVGLAVLDGIALETPLVTTNIADHGPEIDYLVDGVNGSIVKESKNPSVYAYHVSNLLKNDKARERMIAGCRATREKYTIEEMVERFTEGVIKALHS
jgi:glycosyltransferase involved in cell wall biosynthesis